MIVRCYPYNCPNLIACWIAIHNSEHNIYAIFYTVNTEQHFQCVKAKGKKKNSAILIGSYFLMSFRDVLTV